VEPLEDIGISEITPKTLADCQKTLQRYAISTETTNDMLKLDNLVMYGVYAFRGKIQWINQTKLFTAEKTVAGNNPLLCPDGHKPTQIKPTLAMVLDGNKSNYSVTLSIGRQRFGDPVISIPDLTDIIQDVVNEIPNDAEKQVRELKTLLFGRELIGIGAVGKMNPPGANGILYINCSVGFVMQVIDDIPDNSRETLVDEKEVEPACIEINKKEREEKRIDAVAKKEKKPATPVKVEKEETNEEPEEEEEEKPQEKEEKKQAEKISIKPGETKKITKSDITKYVDGLVKHALVNNQEPIFIPFDKCRKVLEIPDTIDNEMIGIIKGRANEIWKSEVAKQKESAKKKEAEPEEDDF